ncbi:MAG: bacillithiol biosynthesis cysteine-adding enzyme BshC [Flavobacteriales bacterium]|nr:bacillithiol biosynthesis cysteine-adding enzyme BshC [Flavobacteriales bacterium]MCB9448058.1 bacillithiol biosynthesis cysteine-adding enzyme BshC [Flavobacteriales bacterium]
MKITPYPLTSLPSTNPLVKDYLQQDAGLSDYFTFAPNREGLADALKIAGEKNWNREVLVNSLLRQYQEAGITVEGAVHDNIEKLRNNNTFTITTGHQLCIFTGPLYYIYKIAGIIRLSQTLREQHPDVHVVPVFWMATEDHDFEEIRSCHLFGKTFTWERDAKGPVGRLSTEGLDQVWHAIDETLGQGEHADELRALFNDAYLNSPSLAEATRKLVHGLFASYGLVILDGDDPELKQLFVDVMTEDALNLSTEPLVKATSGRLEAQYPAQVFPRPVNLFYLGADRYRIKPPEETGNDTYDLGDMQVGRDQLASMIREQPGSFSPNVILRPIYQQIILPNIAYVGGGAEVAYWLQLKAAFNHHKAFYPVVLHRDSLLWIDRNQQTRLDKLDLTWQDLMLDKDDLIRQWLSRHEEAEPSLDEAKKKVEALFGEVATQAAVVDPSLEKAVGAEGQKAVKMLEAIESRIRKAAKKKHETELSQVEQVQAKLFPNGGLQERYDNFIPLYLKHGRGFLDAVIQNADPVSAMLKVVTDDES